MITTKDIANYWDRQAAIWAEEKKEAWQMEETNHWIHFFKELLPNLTGNKVLEVGTASGYFAHILTLAGYDVTAIDYSQEMIAAAKRVTEDFKMDIDFSVMDAQALDFPENTFDLVFTRLMTWTLPDTMSFYTSAFNVLKPGGMLLNFDGDFGKIQFSQEGHERYPEGIMEEANRIKDQLPISRVDRPEEDLKMLETIGFKAAKADLLAQNRILHIDSKTSSLFELRGFKPKHNV